MYLYLYQKSFESNLGKMQDKEPQKFGSLITRSKPLQCPAIKNKKSNHRATQENTGPRVILKNLGDAQKCVDM